MVLKIERQVTSSGTILVLSGRVGSDDVQMLKACMDDGEPVIALDLAQVFLVNLDAVRFFAECEKRGIELRKCRPHLRAWVHIEKPRVGNVG